MKKIRTFYSGVALSAERPFGLSKTVPDMTLSLQELVRRYTRTGAFGDVATFQPIYNGEAEVVPHIERMTQQERLEFSRAVKNYINELRSARRAAPPDSSLEPLEEDIPEQEQQQEQE